MFALMFLMQSVSPLDVTGVWATENGRAQVEISRTAGDSVRGEIIWYASFVEDADERASEREDQLVLGSTLLEGYEADMDGWSNGTIHDLKGGGSYRSSLKRVNARTLEVEGCLLVFCRTQVWTRVAADNVKRVPETSGR